MSYEHCEIHDCEATNGCELCEAEQHDRELCDCAECDNWRRACASRDDSTPYGGLRALVEPFQQPMAASLYKLARMMHASAAPDAATAAVQRAAAEMSNHTRWLLGIDETCICQGERER